MEPVLRHEQLQTPRRMARLVVMLAMLLSSTCTGLLTGHVGMINDFRTATEVTCHSNRMTRQTYTAVTSEMYYFAFETGAHTFWDCRVRNEAAGVADTFRFYGDDGHGGAELWSCENCVFSVQDVGVYFSHDGRWIYKYHWRR